MRSLSLLLFLLAIFVVSIHADDPFITTTSASASSSASSATSTTTASTSATTATSTSTSSTPTSLAVSNAFHWDGGEIAAVVILVGFIVFGAAFITIWQVRRMVAKRRENAGLGAYAKHERNPSADMDVADPDAVIIMNHRAQSPHYNPQSYINHTNNDLERQPTGVAAASSRYSTAGIPPSSTAFPPANSFRLSRSYSPYSEALLRPSSENTLRRLYSFEDYPRSTTLDSLTERVG
jgi:hypothetical protein